MHRRALLAASVAAPLIGRFGLAAGQAEAAEPTPAFAWRQFEVTTRVTLQNSSGPAQLWLPLAQTAAGYQVALEVRGQGTGRHELVRDDTYGAQILRSTWNGASAPQQVEVVQTVATRDRGSLPTVPISQAERRFWTSATPSTPTDGIVRETAERDSPFGS